MNNWEVKCNKIVIIIKIEKKHNTTKSFVFIYEMIQHQMSAASGASGMSWSVLNVALHTATQMTMLRRIRKQMDKVFY